MSDSKRDDLILTTLLDIKENVGQLNAKVDGLHSTLTQHIHEDEAVAIRVSNLEAAHHKQLGATKVWSAVISAIVSGIVGYFSGGYISRGH